VLHVYSPVDARRALPAVYAFLALNYTQVTGHMHVVADFMHVTMAGVRADPQAGVNALETETL
jgi:hypothetical protein